MLVSNNVDPNHIERTSSKNETRKKNCLEFRVYSPEIWIEFDMVNTAVVKRYSYIQFHIFINDILLMKPKEHKCYYTFIIDTIGPQIS